MPRSTLHSGLLLVGALVALTALAACGEDEPAPPPECVDSICEAGESKCLGNTRATCAADGKSWNYEFCGQSAGYCSNGACQPRVCNTLLGGLCTDDTSLSQCNEAGSAQSNVSCDEGNVCRGGGCVPEACAEGETRCSDPYHALSCVSGLWNVTDCVAGEVCVEEGGAAACQAPPCDADSARCVSDDAGESSVVCDSTGRTETVTPCASNEVCKGGFCVEKVCGVDDGGDPDATGGGDGGTPDAGGDQGPPDVEEDVFIPPLEKVSKIEFMLGGIKQTFDLNARADYIATDQNLKIQAGGGARKLEINLAPIEPFTVGQFTDTDSSDTVVIACYYDGGVNVIPEGSGNCGGFSHVSSLYDVTLDEYNPQGRVIGSFTVTLENQLGETVQISEGVFDVAHK